MAYKSDADHERAHPSGRERLPTALRSLLVTDPLAAGAVAGIAAGAVTGSGVAFLLACLAGWGFGTHWLRRSPGA